MWNCKRMSAPLFLAIALVFLALVAGYFLPRLRSAERGTLADLPRRLAQLKLQDNDPKAFLGFCTRAEDALYFVHEKGGFYLDYELNTPAKNAYVAGFRQAASELSFAVIDTSYYGGFPVLRIAVGNSENLAAENGLKLANKLFGYTVETPVEFLP